MKTPPAASLAALLFAAACATAPSQPQPKAGSQPRPLEITGSYTHAPSRFVFAPEVGGARRVTIIPRSDDGKRISVSYGAGSAACPVALTLWLDPAPAGQSQEAMNAAFESARKAEEESFPDAGLVLTDAKETPPIGRRAIYLSPAGVMTDLVVWLIEDGWTVTYRAIQPESCIDEARAVGRTFYQAWSASRRP